MEMNEILNGLNSCGVNDGIAPICPPNGGIGGINNGCGFGSWIWILLILFYSGGFGRKNNNCCPDKCCKKDHCCHGERGYGNTGGCGGFSSYLFLLVILFLCNGCHRDGFGTGNIFGAGCC